VAGGQSTRQVVTIYQVGGQSAQIQIYVRVYLKICRWTPPQIYGGVYLQICR
jgi:hypothetical protein